MNIGEVPNLLFSFSIFSIIPLLLKATKYELSKNISKLLFANDKDFILIDFFFVSKKLAISLDIFRE